MFLCLNNLPFSIEVYADILSTETASGVISAVLNEKWLIKKQTNEYQA